MEMEKLYFIDDEGSDIFNEAMEQATNSLVMNSFFAGVTQAEGKKYFPLFTVPEGKTVILQYLIVSNDCSSDLVDDSQISVHTFSSGRFTSPTVALTRRDFSTDPFYSGIILPYNKVSAVISSGGLPMVFTGPLQVCLFIENRESFDISHINVQCFTHMISKSILYTPEINKVFFIKDHDKMVPYDAGSDIIYELVKAQNDAIGILKSELLVGGKTTNHLPLFANFDRGVVIEDIMMVLEDSSLRFASSIGIEVSKSGCWKTATDIVTLFERKNYFVDSLSEGRFISLANVTRPPIQTGFFPIYIPKSYNSRLVIYNDNPIGSDVNFVLNIKYRMSEYNIELEYKKTHALIEERV